MFVSLWNIKQRIHFLAVTVEYSSDQKFEPFNLIPQDKNKSLPVPFFFFFVQGCYMVTSFLGGCKYSLYVSPYKRNRVCSASRNYLALLLSGVSSSPTNKASLAQEGSWHSQPSHYKPSFPAPHVENNPKADWGIGFQELLPWWGSQLMKKTPNNKLWGQWAEPAHKGRKERVGRWEGQAGEYQNQGEVGLHHQTQRNKQAGQSLFSIQLRCAWMGWIKSNL